MQQFGAHCYNHVSIKCLWLQDLGHKLFCNPCLCIKNKTNYTPYKFLLKNYFAKPYYIITNWKFQFLDSFLY